MKQAACTALGAAQEKDTAIQPHSSSRFSPIRKLQARPSSKSIDKKKNLK
jgi:hypothetical protein